MPEKRSVADRAMDIRTRIEVLRRQAHLNEKYAKELGNTNSDYMAGVQMSASAQKRAEAEMLEAELHEQEEAGFAV